jgi:autotransporter-associated beta strand protein
LNANRGIFLGALGGSINVQSSETLTILGVISGTGPFYASPNYSAGYGTIILSAANTYSGPTIIGAGTLELGINGALPYGTPLTIGSSDQGAVDGSFFNMNSKTQTIGPLSSSPGINGLNGTGTPTIQMSGALTILQTNVSTTFGGGITGAGSLTISIPAGGVPGTLTLTNTNNFTGAAVINGGTLALAGAKGSISNTASITIASGGTLDVSGVTSGTFSLSSSSSLTASGIGTSSTAATINGPSSGTVSLGSRPVTLKYSPASSSGDLASPALYVAQGTLALNGNALTVNNISGTPMAAGTYTLISAGSGIIISNGTFTVSVTGSGLAASATTSLQFTNGSVNLVVAMNIPTISSIVSGGVGSSNVVLSGNGGSPNGSFHVISSTDVTAPLSQWTVISTNAFNATGSFTVTNTATNTPEFFMIRVP